MALATILRLIQLPRNLILPAQYTIQKCDYAVAPKKRKLQEKVVIPVETDPQRLVTYCCGSNFYNEGEDVKLKPDSEYPDWLWTLRIHKRTLKEVEPDTKEYWRIMRRLWLRQKNRMASKKRR